MIRLILSFADFIAVAYARVFKFAEIALLLRFQICTSPAVVL